MDTNSKPIDKIISRLALYNYTYELKEDVLKIHLPMLCYLKINFKDGKIKMTSHIRIAMSYFPLEYNFLFYGLGFYILTWYFWANLNKAVFLLFGLFIIYFVICFIKIEIMKLIVHNWIDKENP